MWLLVLVEYMSIEDLFLVEGIGSIVFLGSIIFFGIWSGEVISLIISVDLCVVNCEKFGILFVKLNCVYIIG